MRTAFVVNLLPWSINPRCQHKTRVSEPIRSRDSALLCRRRVWCPQTARSFRRLRSAGGWSFRMELHDDAEAPRIDFDDTDLDNAQSASIGDSNSSVTPAPKPSSARKTRSRRTPMTREGDSASAVEQASPNAIEKNGPSLTPEPTSSETSTSRSKPRRAGQKSGQKHLAREVASANIPEDATTGKIEAQQMDKGVRAASKTGAQRRSRKGSTEKEVMDAAPLIDSSKEALNGTSASGTNSRGKARSASRSRSKKSNISEDEKTATEAEQSERPASVRSDTPSLSDKSDERIPAEMSSSPSADRRLKERGSSRGAAHIRSTSSKAASFATPKSENASHESSIAYGDLFAPASEATVGADTNDEAASASMESSAEGPNFIPNWPDDADGDDLIADMRSPLGDPSAQISNRESSSERTSAVPDPEVGSRSGLDDMIGMIEEPWDPELLERARQRVQAKHPLGRSELIGESYKPLPSNPNPEPTEQELLVDDSTSHEYLPLIAPGSPFQRAYQRLIHSNISYKELDRWSQGGQPPRVLGVLFGPSNPPPLPIPGQRIETGEGPPLPLPDRMVWKVRDQRPADVSNADLLTDIGFASSSDEDIEQALEELLQRDARTDGGRYRFDLNQKEWKKGTSDRDEDHEDDPDMTDDASTTLAEQQERSSRQDTTPRDEPKSMETSAYEDDPASSSDDYDPYQLRFANEVNLDAAIDAEEDSDSGNPTRGSGRRTGPHAGARWGPTRRRYEEEEDQRRQAGAPPTRMAETKRIAGVLTMPNSFPAHYELRILLRNPVPNEAVERILQDIESVLRREVEEDAFWIELVGDMKRVVVRVHVHYQSQVENLYSHLCKHETIAALHGDQIDGIIGRDEEFV